MSWVWFSGVLILSVFSLIVSITPNAFAYDFDYEVDVPKTFTKNGNVITSGTEICNGIPPSTNPDFPVDVNGHKQVWVKFNGNFFPDHAAGKLYVKDRSANTDPAKVDFVCVNLSSQRTGNNVDVVLRETGINTGFFESIAYARFSSVMLTNDYNFGPDLLVNTTNGNDVITATYSNQTSSITNTIILKSHPRDVERGGWGNIGYTVSPSQLKQDTARVVCVDDIELVGVGDGVCDEWEQGGRLSISFNGKTYTGPECGGAEQDTCPSPNKIDVFVEVDYSGGVYGTELNEVIQKIKDTFLGYKSGRISEAGTGIYYPVHVHIQKDEGDKELIPMTTEFPGNTVYPHGFNVTKAFYFGTGEERGNTITPSPDNAPPDWAFQQKSQVFHYIQFVDRIDNVPGSTGYAELWGNDIVVAKNPMAWGGTVDELTGTTLHELGHNLGLNHGGHINDQINCKPNYLSVMSYTFQMPYYLGTLWKPDLSWTQLNTLPENGLWEPTGLWTYPSGIGYTFYYTGWNFRYAPQNIDIDWNGSYDIQRQQNVIIDVNDLNIAGCIDSPGQTLSGHQDWGSNLKYNFRFTPNFAASGIHTDPVALDEMDEETISDIFEVMNGPHPLVDYGTFEAYTSVAPSIDGVEDAIWANADTVEMRMDFPHHANMLWQTLDDEYDVDIKLSIMNDEQNMYIKILSEGNTTSWKNIWSEFRFDINHIHDLANPSFESDRKTIHIMLDVPSSSYSNDLYYSVYQSIISDEDIHGTNDVIFASHNEPNWNIIEMSIPLCSGDPDDFCLQEEDDIGFRYLHNVDFINSNSTGQWSFPGWPSSGGPDVGFHFVAASP